MWIGQIRKPYPVNLYSCKIFKAADFPLGAAHCISTVRVAREAQAMYSYEGMTGEAGSRFSVVLDLQRRGVRL